MKVLLLLMSLLFTTAFAQDQSPETVNPEIFWGHLPLHPFHPKPYFHHPHFLPHPIYVIPGYPWTYNPNQPQSPPANTSPSSPPAIPNDSMFEDAYTYFSRHSPVSDDHMKCFLAVHDRSMGSCLSDFHSFLATHRVSVSSTCCSALQNVEDSCQHVHPFLKDFISNECSNVAPPPSS